MEHKKIIPLFVAFALLLCIAAPFGASAQSDEPLEIFFFYEDGCSDCNAFKPILEDIEAEYGDAIVVTRYDVFTSEGWDLYTSYGFNKVPSIVIGSSTIQYDPDIFTMSGITGIIETELGGVTVTLEYFYEDGCDACVAFKPSLALLKDKYGSALVVEEIDVFTAEGWDKFSGYGFLKTPSVAINGESLVEYPETTYERLDELITSAMEGEGEGYSNITQWSITVAFTLGFFSSFSPCLMAVLSFILAYMSL